MYLFLKFIHILSSTILFGTGIGTAFNMFMANRTKDLYIISATARYVVFADWIFTSPSGVIQPLTGFWMVGLAGYGFNQFWIWASIVGYLIAAFCWFPVVYLQLKMRDMAVQALREKTPLPPRYYRYYNYWFWLGWPAFISLIAVFYMMTHKPMGFTF